MLNIYEAQALNKRKSFVVVFSFFLFVGIALYFIINAFNYYYGYQLGGLGVVGIALIFSGVTSFISYYFSDKIVLSISRARPASREKDFKFYTSAENLSIGAGVPMPKLYVIEDSAPNAFATGRNPENAVICVTTGLLDKLNKSELEGVIGHELTHIKNYDIRLQTIVVVMVGLIALLSDIFLRGRLFAGGRRSDRGEGKLAGIIMLLGIVFVILSPFIAKLIQLAISRKREYAADSGSVFITRQPSGLISALEKISEDKENLEVANKATAHLYIVSPFKRKNSGAVNWFSNLFNTHPPVHERLKALKKMQ